MSPAKSNSTDVEIAIITRFYEAIRELIRLKVIRGINTFTTKYGINRRNFTTIEKCPERCRMFHLDWISYLVRDFKVSPYWILLGKGNMFLKDWETGERQTKNGVR